MWNLVWKSPGAHIKGNTTRIINDRIQLAVKAIARPPNAVAMFCTISASASPTTVLTVEASIDNLAHNAPLHSIKLHVLAHVKLQGEFNDY